MSSKANYKVYMDVKIGASDAGRIVFELFNDLTSKTAQNFRGLCTGEYGKVGNIKLHYLNTKFHRIIDGFVIQGGDISNSGGKGGYSIYGRTFMDQNFSRTHSCAGLLSMANCGRNTNSSQFFITLKACPHLDGKHVVFGQVIDGMEVVKKISKVPIDKEDKPRIPVVVLDCGQVGDFKAFLRYDPFKRDVFEQIRERKQKVIKDQYMIRKLLAEGMDPNEAYQYKQKLQKTERDLMQLNKQEQLLKLQQQEKKVKQSIPDPQQQLEKIAQSQPTLNQSIKQKFGQKNVDKFLDLKLRLNQAKVANSKAALQQQIRENDTNYHKMVKKNNWLEKKKQAEQELQARGLSKEKIYLNRNALQKEDDKGQSTKNQNFGWNVYSEEAYYRAYEKRCQSLQKNHQEIYDSYGARKQPQNADPSSLKKQQQTDTIKNFRTSQKTLQSKSGPSQEALQRLQADILKQQEKRSQFSRRRLHDQDQTVDYINERNRVYNKKLQRNFSTYASGIKTSLQINSQKK